MPAPIRNAGGIIPRERWRARRRFERRHEPLLPRAMFLRRFARWVFAAGVLILGSLVMGILGYHILVGLPWLDSLLNASMILGGMGPVDPVKTAAGKIFASCYALYSGLALISGAGLIFTPIIHRLLHKFHIEMDDDSAGEKKQKG